MKKALAVLLTVPILLCLAPIHALAGPTMDRIVKKQTLVVGLTGTQPPMNATTKNGDLIGLDVDIAKDMAAAMDVEIEFKTMAFTDLLPALEKGKIDMVISGMTATATRNKRVAFVGPYYVSGKGMLAKAERYKTLKAGEGLNAPEVTAAALKDSTSQKYIEALLPKTKLVTTASYDEAIEMILADKVDLLVADYPFCALTAYRYVDKGLAAGQSPLTFEPLGIAMLEDPLLINWVQNFLTSLEGSGELKTMRSKWLSGGSWVEELP